MKMRSRRTQIEVRYIGRFGKEDKYATEVTVPLGEGMVIQSGFVVREALRRKGEAIARHTMAAVARDALFKLSERSEITWIDPEGVKRTVRVGPGGDLAVGWLRDATSPMFDAVEDR